MIIWLYANLETMSRFHNSIMLIGEDDRQTLERKGSLELCWSKYFLLWATEVKRCQGGGVYPLHQLQTRALSIEETDNLKIFGIVSDDVGVVSSIMARL